MIFAGKGGVGKTTASSATGLWLARQGKRTLVVTVDPAKRLGDSLGVEIGFKDTAVAENLHALMVDPRTVVEDYLRKQAPGVEGELTAHPVFKYVSDHMPGLNELLAIGKLLELRDAAKYEAIVVDTAPTGHALTFLSAPQYVREIMSEQSIIRLVVKGWKFYSNAKKLAAGVKGLFTGEEPDVPDIDLEKVFNGFKDEAARIEEMLTDPETTVLHVVTNPERLAIQETMDILKRVRELRIPVGSVVVNKVQPDALGDLRSDFLRVNDDDATKDRLKDVLAASGYSPELMKRVVATVAFSDIRRQMNLQWLDEMRKQGGVPVVEVPLFSREVSGLELLGEFGDHLFGEERRDPRAGRP